MDEQYDICQLFHCFVRTSNSQPSQVSQPTSPKGLKHESSNYRLFAEFSRCTFFEISHFACMLRIRNTHSSREELARTSPFLEKSLKKYLIRIDLTKSFCMLPCMNVKDSLKILRKRNVLKVLNLLHLPETLPCTWN